jgi:hypothetical protein
MTTFARRRARRSAERAYRAAAAAVTNAKLRLATAETLVAQMQIVCDEANFGAGANDLDSPEFNGWVEADNIRTAAKVALETAEETLRLAESARRNANLGADVVCYGEAHVELADEEHLFYALEIIVRPLVVEARGWYGGNVGFERSDAAWSVWPVGRVREIRPGDWFEEMFT